MQLPERVLLKDLSPHLVEAWEREFDGIPAITAAVDDFFAEPADAVVSPANSFGVMDGGLDLLIRSTLDGVEDAVQRMIVEKHHGELPVGCAEVVASKSQEWPYVICAPTMRVPENISASANPYLAFRATLLAIARFNDGEPELAIRSVVVPGLGTGVGRVSPNRCAAQMRLAYDSVSGPGDIQSIHAIHTTHVKLLGS